MGELNRLAKATEPKQDDSGVSTAHVWTEQRQQDAEGSRLPRVTADRERSEINLSISETAIPQQGQEDSKT